MAHINIDRSTVNTLYRDDIIAVLQGMIHDELQKDMTKVNTDFVDECVDALLEIEQDRDGSFAVFIPLMSSAEFLKRINGRKQYWRRMNKFTRAAVAAAVIAASSFTVNAAVDGVTGVNLFKEAGTRIQQSLQNWVLAEQEGIDQGEDVDEDFGIETTKPVSETSVSEVTEMQSKTVSKEAEESSTRYLTTQEGIDQQEDPYHFGEETTVSSTPERTTRETTQKKTRTTIQGTIEKEKPEDAEKISILSLEAALDNFKTDYIYGEELTYEGIALTAYYSNGTSEEVSLSDCDYTKALNMNVTADYTLRIIYKGCTVKIDITVRPDEETRGSERNANDAFEYLLTKNGAYITKYKGSGKDIDLTEIDGNPVYAVSSGVFENSDIETVYAPDVKKIFSSAFRNAKALRTCTSPEAVYIGESAFAGCENLERPSFSGKATYLGEAAYQASGITEITIPSGISEVPKNLCEGCTRLTSVDLGNAQGIGENAFSESAGIESIKGMKKVKQVSNFAFYGLEKAELDEAPALLESVGDSAFAYCKKMEITSLPATVKKIGKYSFMYCYALETVQLQEGITEVPEGAFWGAHVKELTLPDGLKAIRSAAFMSTVIKEVTIPKSVETIESKALYALAKTNVTFEGDVKSIADGAFYQNRYLKFYVLDYTNPLEYAKKNGIDYEIVGPFNENRGSHLGSFDGIDQGEDTEEDF